MKQEHANIKFCIVISWVMLKVRQKLPDEKKTNTIYELFMKEKYKHFKQTLVLEILPEKHFTQIIIAKSRMLRDEAEASKQTSKLNKNR
ncbi:CLUMA_CG009565, isoform A [Clunio marinus]|uniref:CLUMA_CG009565, isoform A n=1 Tax=Clunio marinus TaxID=568069 RepID=A0A1J1I747_9DIPT|nr:CLUMA_CG009565, isoform A [Clunio marinus]